MSALYVQNPSAYGFQEYLMNLLAIPYEKDGKLYDRLTDAEYIRWLKTFRQAYAEGLMDVDFFVDGQAQVDEKTNNGRYFMQIREYPSILAGNTILMANDPKSYYMAVDGPANSKLEPAKLFPGSMTGWLPVMVTKSCKTPDRAIRFISYWASEEGQKDFFLGKKGETWDTIDGKDQLLPDTLNLLNTDLDKFENEIGATDTYWMLRNPITVAKWRPQRPPEIQQLIDWSNAHADYAGGIYKDLSAPPDSDEGVIATKIGQDWDQTLPKLLTAQTEAEFDSLFTDFIKRRADMGFEKLVAYQQKLLNERKAKLK